MVGMLAWAGGPAAAEQKAQLPSPLKDADFHPTDPRRVALGRLLFHDKILSGNRNIACATCHHPDLATTDRVSLPLGEGAIGVGRSRRVDDLSDLTRKAIRFRVPRNTPALFNLGARSFTALQWDGRIKEAPHDPAGFDTPAEEYLPHGLTSVLAAQALFPMVSALEMLGDGNENDIAKLMEDTAELGRPKAWAAIARRVGSVEGYVPLFTRAFEDVTGPDDIRIIHIANALAEFITVEFRADGSAYDAYLAGDESALSEDARRGLALFGGKAGCAGCHTGPLQTDQDFHAIAMPQIGYARSRVWDPVIRDRGRVNETDRATDVYKFRTPSLRNVAHTAPYGHAGAYRTLEAVIRHHLDPLAGLDGYDPAQAVLPPHPTLSAKDHHVLENAREQAGIRAANSLRPVSLTDEEIGALIAFLDALTDPASLNGRLGVPDRVPSGLPVDVVLPERGADG